jgi:DMSO/TMAO reductase YedYZ molybdopterin-dependent catalytic subunit
MLRRGFGLEQRLRPEGMTSFITAESDLFSVWHLGVPDVTTEAWTLEVGGAVRHPLSLSLDDLRAMPQARITSVHECAGSPLAPTIPQRRVGNVQWGGVRLSDILDLAGIGERAAYVLSEGCDHGEFGSADHPRYEKDLPIAKAVDGATLIALTINGDPLSVWRGGPVRLVVPGYYGTNSTKWLTSLTVSDRRSSGAFTTTYYMDPPGDGSSAAVPVWALAPNSCIVAPVDGQVRARTPVEIWGWAWAADRVSAVEVSLDAGHTWAPAQVAPRTGHAWQKFTFAWTPAMVGEYVLACRATTSSGATQPPAARRNRIYQRVIFVTQGSA